MPFDEVALTSKIADDASRMRLNFGAQAGNTADAAAKSVAKQDPCNSEADRGKQGQVALLRLEWLARADALYTVSEPLQFGKDMTALGPTHALRRPEYDRMREAFIKNAGDAAWNPLLASIAQARSVLILACGDRIRFQTQEPRKCPAIPPDGRKFSVVALAQLKSVETFASVYEAAAKALTAVELAAASDRSRLWKVVQPGAALALLGGVACVSGDSVVDFTGPRARAGKDASGKDLVIAPVIAFGNPAEIGQVTVAREGATYALIQADGKATAAGISGKIIFKHCAPA